MSAAETAERPTRPEIDKYFRCEPGSGDTYVVSWWCPRCEGAPIVEVLRPEKYERHGLLWLRKRPAEDEREFEFICGCGYPHQLPGDHPADKTGCWNGFLLKVKFPPCSADSKLRVA